MAHSHRARRNGDEAETTEPKTEAQTTNEPPRPTLRVGSPDAPATCALQPTPVKALALHWMGTTTIARHWANGDGARCRLCPRDVCCLTSVGMCMVRLGRHVPDEDAALAPWSEDARFVRLSGAGVDPRDRVGRDVVGRA